MEIKSPGCSEIYLGLTITLVTTMQMHGTLVNQIEPENPTERCICYITQNLCQRKFEKRKYYDYAGSYIMLLWERLLNNC